MSLEKPLNKTVMILCCTAAFGAICVTYLVNVVKDSFAAVKVKGLSEKVIKSDIGTVEISVTYANKDLDKLLETRIKAKDAIYKFLNDNGYKNEDVTDVNYNMYHSKEKDVSISKDIPGTKIEKEVRVYNFNDTISINSKDVDRLHNLCQKQDALLDLTKNGIMVSFKEQYKVENFFAVKEQLLQEASSNARKTAEILLSANGKKIEETMDLRQGEISITSPMKDYDDPASIYKKYRLVVNAGYR